MSISNKRTRPKTWSIQGNVRKKPSEYEIVTGKLHYHFRREPSPFELDPHAPMNDWFRKYREGSAFQVDDWEGVRDPQQLTYRRYVRQQHDGETYIENLIDEFERQDHDAHLDANWVKVLEQFYIPSRYPLHILQMCSLYLGHIAPSAYIANAAFFQAGDELRALQWSAYRAKSLSLVHYAELANSASTRFIWEEVGAWQPLREVLEKLLIVYDWGEAFAALNLVVKPLFDQVLLIEFAQTARSNGDALGALMLAHFARDSVYSQNWSRALWQYAVKQRPENQPLLEGWIEKWLPSTLGAVSTLISLWHDAPRPVDQEQIIQSVDDAYQAFRASWSV